MPPPIKNDELNGLYSAGATEPIQFRAIRVTIRGTKRDLKVPSRQGRALRAKIVERAASPTIFGL